MAKKNTLRKSISHKKRQEILKRDGYLCGYCEIPKRKKPASLVIDHIIPVKDGGHHGPENWVAACRSCNRKKWLHSPNEAGAPKLHWFKRGAVAKVTTMGVIFRRRIPVVTHRRP